MIPGKKSNVSLWQYASIGTQFLIGIGIAVFLGLKGDQWLNFKKVPLLVCIFPLIMITAFILKLVKNTAKKNEERK